MLSIYIILCYLTISPFRNFGGNHDTIIFVLEDGIALMLCGADGTMRRGVSLNKLVHVKCEYMNYLQSSFVMQ